MELKRRCMPPLCQKPEHPRPPICQKWPILGSRARARAARPRSVHHHISRYSNAGRNFSDIVWRDTSGNVAIWLLNGFQILQAGGLGNVGGSWSVAGTADFNRDGNTHILWRDTSASVQNRGG